MASRAASAIQLCEAAGYDLILVELSSWSKRSGREDMGDILMLMLIGGAGDDVQASSRGRRNGRLLVVHKAEAEHRKRVDLQRVSPGVACASTPPSDVNLAQSG